MEISIVIPVYNEEENIKVLCERIRQAITGLCPEFEIVFINDGSADGSMEQIRELAGKYPEVKYIDFSRNFGHQIAVSAGIDYAKGNAIVIIDADLQDPPELIPELYLKMKEGYEVVYARRKSRKGESYFKKLTARLFYRLLARMTRIKIPVDAGDFRIIDRKIVEVLRQMPEKHKYLRGQISWIGFNQTYIEYERRERNAGKSGYSFRKMLHFALDGITAFSDVPLKIVTFFGLLVSIFAFVVALYALYSRYILKDYVQGWTSLMISVLFIGGVQMIAIGIIGEYLSRMNADVRNRPLYVVKDTNLQGLND
jgi:polyisoprenyl-phosphate glycosyltransferase